MGNQRNSLMTTTTWLVGALAATAIMAGNSAQAADCAEMGGEGDKCLAIASALEPGSLYVIRDGDDGNTLVNWSINEPLVDRDASGALVPVLAAELPVPDAKDPTIWHVKLREGIKFTNGEPFNAAAVKHNIDLVANPDFGASINGIETLKTAKVIDDHTVDIVTKEPDPWLLYRISTLRFVPPEASKDATAYSQHPVGTGPYKFVRWDKGQRIILEKNADYWGGDKAEMDRVSFVFIPEAATRISALKAGEVDMVSSLTPEDAAKVPKVITSSNAANGTYLRFNLETPPYDNKAFRQALIYAINRDALNEYLWAKQGSVEACQTLPPGEVGFNKSLQAYPYDPEKAKQLLAQVKLPEDFVVRAVFTTGGYLPKDSETGQAIAADWEAIGLKTKIEYVSSDKWLDDILAGGEKTKPDSPAPMTYVQLDYHSMYAARITSRIFSRTNKMSGLGTSYPELDAALATAQGSFDVPKATAAFEQVYKIGCDEALYIPLIDYPDIWGAVEGVNYEAGPGVLTRIHLDRVHVD
ncbi:dipeptide/oligopeptide ABC transporter substrate-binding protein (plasmid) [Sinorhizobium fredii]|uniref:Dipeptide/oligopeptide ABC transporter substrate-binding protein n=2 Tax=Rhizobium fredii TaxID=380 RepID=A0A2L0HAY1_RHIFR|nr:dipeptide/oligopeptide ABC transporter substrate-binding protein [Sinorhizobium fredii]